MYYRTTLLASSLKELSPRFIHFRELGSITECPPGSPGLCRTVLGSEISHNGESPVFICCTVPEFSQFCFCNFVSVNAVHDSISGEF